MMITDDMVDRAGRERDATVARLEAERDAATDSAYHLRGILESVATTLSGSSDPSVAIVIGLVRAGLAAVPQ